MPTSTPVPSQCAASNLINAINAANSTSDDDVVELVGTCTYRLEAIDNWDSADSSANGLPAVVDTTTGGTLTINGNGATIQRDSDDLFRIFYANTDASLTLNNVTIYNGSTDTYGGGIYNDGGTVALIDSTIYYNGAYSGGGGIFSIGDLTLTNSIVVNNGAGTYGGGIYNVIGTMTIVNSTLSGNYAYYDGGGIENDGGGTVNITNSTIYDNEAGVGNGAGGGIDNYSGTVNMGNSIVAGNTAALVGPDIYGTVNSNNYNLIQDDTDTVFTGTTTDHIIGQDPLLDPLAENGGPTWTHSLQFGSPAIDKIPPGDCPTTDQRGITRNVGNCDIGAYEAVYTLTVAGSGYGDGTITGTGFSCTSVASVTSGDCDNIGSPGSSFEITATSSGLSTFVSWTGCTSTSGSNNEICTIMLSSPDTTVTAEFKAGTTTAITLDHPDPSAVGQAVTVNFTVTSASSGTPTGNVTISDGTDSCTGTVVAGSCEITFTSVGERTLTATYVGDSNFNGSVSVGEPHTVNKADTTTTITLDHPDPSTVGQAVTVNFTVTPASSVTPTGNVTISDGIDSCMGTVAAGTCTLTTTTAGNKALTATYVGDSNFNGSVSVGEPHTVNKADTTTTITLDHPDPSIVGQAVTVNFTVTPASSVTPTGNVTISDDTDSCTGTVATGSCEITFTSVGERTLTATYVGDSNFNGSVSVGEPHTVNKADTTTTVTLDHPDPSAVGQAVTVNFTVTPASSVTPTGNVTISDGTDSCTGTVATGSCEITFTSVGERTLTATYVGDSSFNGSVSVGETHTVHKADTTTTITEDTPDPSIVEQVATVSFTVVANAPGDGTPTGDVLVSDGVDSCTGTVAAGSCEITFTSVGEKTLTATYLGDADFMGSVSADAIHRVLTAVTITEQELFAQLQSEIAANPAITGVDFILPDFVPGALNLSVRTTTGTIGDVTVTVSGEGGYVVMTLASITVNGAAPTQDYTDVIHRELMLALTNSFDALLIQKTGFTDIDVFSMTVDDTLITVTFQ